MSQARLRQSLILDGKSSAAAVASYDRAVPTRSWPGWLGFDVLAVLLFVVIGRATHTKGETVVGIASTAWPFLSGLVVAWFVTGAWRRPRAAVRSGLYGAVVCVAIGMVLRVLAGQGTAVAFVFVALGFLGLAMTGWRLCFSIARGARMARRISAWRRSLRFPSPLD